MLVRNFWTHKPHRKCLFLFINDFSLYIPRFMILVSLISWIFCNVLSAKQLPAVLTNFKPRTQFQNNFNYNYTCVESYIYALLFIPLNIVPGTYSKKSVQADTLSIITFVRQKRCLKLDLEIHICQSIFMLQITLYPYSLYSALCFETIIFFN